MNDRHLLDVLAKRRGCFISDLCLIPMLRRAALFDMLKMDADSYPLRQWHDAVRYLTGDERTFESVSEIKDFLRKEVKS